MSNMDNYITKQNAKEIIQQDMSSMDCTPYTDTGVPETDTVEVYQLTNKDANTLAMEKLSSMIINFFIFIFLILFSIILVPFFYKNIIINFVETSLKDSNVADKDKAGSLRVFDWFINIILISIIIAIIVDGNKKSNNTESIIGVFSLIFLIIVNVIIFLLKIFRSADYNFGQEITTNPKFEFIGTIIKKIYEIIKNNGFQILSIFVLFTGILFFISFLSFLALNINFFNPAKNYPMIFIIGAVLSLAAIKVFGS